VAPFSSLLGRFSVSRKVSKGKPDFQVKVRRVVMPDADQRLACAIELLLAMCQQKLSTGAEEDKVQGNNSDSNPSK